VKTFKIIPALLISLFATSSYAASGGGLFVEPFVTYEAGSKTELDWPSPFQNSEGSSEGLGVGARIGGHVADIVFIAADLRYSKPQFKDSTNNMDVGADQYNYGATVGVQTPFAGIRVWGSYILGSELNPQEDNGVDAKFTDGKGYRVGAGIHLAMVSLNLEYQDLKYEKTTIENGGVFAGTELDTDLTNKSYILSVGFPFEF
jgi:hypothetical protein